MALKAHVDLQEHRTLEEDRGRRNASRTASMAREWREDRKRDSTSNSMAFLT